MPLPSSLLETVEARAAEASVDVYALLLRARKRQRAILHTSAALVAVAALALLTPLLLALAATGTPAARPLGLLALLAVAGAFAWWGPLRSRRQVGGLGATARMLAERLSHPALRRGLIPAFELADELATDSDPNALGFSRALAQAHITGVAQAARAADLTAALPDRSVRLAGRALFAATLVLFGAALAFHEPLGRGLRLLVLGRDVPVAKQAPSAEPVTGEIALTYVYPAYTRLAQRTVPNTNGDISAPKGTQVQLHTRADREVDQAFLLLGNAALPLKVAQGRELSGSLVVGGPGSYRFRFLDKRGRTLVEGPPIPIAVEEDTAPKVSLVTPMGDTEVDPNSRVSVRFDAEDDFGLTEVALLYKLPGAAKPQRVVLKRASDHPRRASGEHLWDLVTPGLSPGDTISYYLEAVDDDEVSGKKTGTSRTQKLTIYSEAEHRRKLLKKIEESWEKLVMLLADRLESPDRKREGRTAETIRSQAKVDERSLQLAREFQELARTLRKEKTPDQITGAVAMVAAGLLEKAGATANERERLSMWLGRGATMDSEPVRRLMRALESEIAEEEKEVLYLESLVDQQRIADLIALTKELSAKRRELADVLEKYRQAPDEATRDDLLNQVARLKERMGELMKRMAELSRSINDEHLNAEALAELSQTGELMDAFDKLQELLYQGKVEEAMKEMEKLGQALDAMEQNLQKASQEFKGGEFDQTAKELAQFAQDLDQLQEQQQDLVEDTQRVRSNYKKALDDRLDAKGQDFVERLRRKGEEARKKLEAVQNPANFFREDDVKHAKDALQDLDMALATKDFDQAQQAAAKALAHAQAVAEEYERQAHDLRRFPNAALQPRTAEAQQNAATTKAALPPLREVSKELQSLFPSPAMAMSEQDRQQMKDLAQRQEQLQKNAGKLSQKMDELNQQAPLFPGEAQQMLQQAGGRMGRAQNQMNARNPTGAVAEERAALDQIAALKKGLSKESGGGSGSAQGGPPWPWLAPGSPQQGRGEREGPGRREDDKVEIPGADQYQVPPEYRRDILEAMKQGAPEKYKDQLKRYYEEIVK